jgi:hypothetical protein
MEPGIEIGRIRIDRNQDRPMFLRGQAAVSHQSDFHRSTGAANCVIGWMMCGATLGRVIHTISIVSPQLTVIRVISWRGAAP